VSRIKNLNRFRTLTGRELRVRCRQQLSKLSERFLGLSQGEMSDKSFLDQVKASSIEGSAEAAATSIINNLQNVGISDPATTAQNLFPSLSDREVIVSMLGQRFPSERFQIVDCAERAIQGHFDLLGFKNLSFGQPPDWHLEPTSGKRSLLKHWSRIKFLEPEIAGDKKITWELNRHQHFVTLGQAYWITGDEKFAEAFVIQATSWMEANPPKQGINWASSLELAFRAIAWLWAIHLFAGSLYLTGRFKLRLLKYLIAQGLHLESYLSHYFSPNTHLTGEALGLFYLGCAMPEFERAETWRDVGLRILLEQLNHQIRDDGVYFEQTTYYHRYTADFYIHLLVLARARKIPIPEELELKLSQLITHLMWITRPDGSSPLIGDDDGGRLLKLGPRKLDDFRDTISIGAVLFGRGDWKQAAGRATVELLWLLGPSALNHYDLLPCYEPGDLSRVFPDSGLCVMRDGWARESRYVVMDCGPHGSLSCAHSHADALSIEFSALGRNWIMDPGTYTYTGDSELRNWFRSTKAHNTVTIDGVSQSITAGPFSWERIASSRVDDFIDGKDFDYVRASHDGYERLDNPVQHSRAIISPKQEPNGDLQSSLASYLIVHDSFITSGSHEYSVRFHIAPGCSAFAIGNHATVTEPGGRRLNITGFGRSTVQARVTHSWVSRAYGERQPAVVVVFEFHETGSHQFTTFIVPATEGQSIAVDHCIEDPAQNHRFQITAGAICDVVLIGERGGTMRYGFLSAAGSVAWARFESDDFARGFLIRGYRFETTDGFAFRSAALIRHCSMRRTVGGSEWSIDGVAPFQLKNSENRLNMEISGTAFEVSQPVSTFAGGAWGVSDQSSEAIN